VTASLFVVCTATALFADPSGMPNPRLTPGAVATTDVATVCQAAMRRPAKTASFSTEER
jgi:hypothetical protein